MVLRRRCVILAALLTPVTLFPGIFFVLPLLIIAVFSVLTPGLYGGVEWAFYHWTYGRIFGRATGSWRPTSRSTCASSCARSASRP